MDIMGWNIAFMCCDIVGVCAMLLVTYCKHDAQIDKVILRFS